MPGEVIDKVVALIVSTPPEIAQRYANAFAIREIAPAPPSFGRARRAFDSNVDQFAAKQ